MLAILASTALTLLASLLLGRAILLAVEWPRPAWLAGAIGFAALTVIAPLLVRLPGRATTAAILVALLVVGAGLAYRRSDRSRSPQAAGGEEAGAQPASWRSGVVVVAITVAMAALPFLFNERLGILGEGIYTNDHAAQLYWAEWLRTGFGPEPSAVSFGYPIGPQAVAVIVAQATGSSLVSAFNGLLLAIPALTGLAALSALNAMPSGRRIAIAVICGLPYLAASFLAQSAFKETAMALFVLAFALALERGSSPEPEPGAARWRAILICGLLLAAASVFTFSIPGLAWFALGIPIWLALELVAGRSPIAWRALGEALRAHRAAIAVAGVACVVVAVVAIGPATNFIEKIGDVQASAGRLASPVFPGEALGIWPEGDFRIVRGEVPGAVVATLLGAVAVGYGLWTLIRNRRFALPAILLAGGIVYLGARLFAEIHVEAKALAVIAPLALLVGLRALLGGPADRGRQGSESSRSPGRSFQGSAGARHLVGWVVLVAAFGSTFLAQLAAPVGFDDRGAGLERLAEGIQGESIAFLGVDRFAGYRLRGTLARAPAGYVPEEIETRPEKVWQQGQAADFDSLDSGKLDKFDYAITTAADYQSAAPTNFRVVGQEGGYLLWERDGETPRSRVVDGEDGAPGVEAFCVDREGEPDGAAGGGGRSERPAIASVFATPPVLSGDSGWKGQAPAERAAGGQEGAFLAPDTSTIELDLPEPGTYELSLQYHSQVPLEVLFADQPIAELPASLDGMYLDGAGRGAFWPAGEITVAEGGEIEIAVRAEAPSALQDLLGVERRVWLGELAATSSADPAQQRLARLCAPYIDHYRLARGSRQ